MPCIPAHPGWSAQHLRMNLISTNIANADTIRTPQGGPYQRKEPIFAAQVENTSFKGHGCGAVGRKNRHGGGGAGLSTIRVRP